MKIQTFFMFGWGGKVCIVIKAKCTRAWFKWSKKLPQKWWKIVDGIVGPLWSNEETVTLLKWLHEINRLMLPAVYLGEPSLNGMGGNVKSFAFYPVAFHHILMKALPEYSGYHVTRVWSTPVSASKISYQSSYNPSFSCQDKFLKPQSTTQGKAKRPKSGIVWKKCLCK